MKLCTHLVSITNIHDWIVTIMLASYSATSQMVSINTDNKCIVDKNIFKVNNSKIGRSVPRALPNICDGIFSRKQLMVKRHCQFTIVAWQGPKSNGSYMFKVNYRSNKTRWEICSKLTMRTPDVSLLLTLNIFHFLF